MAPVLSVSPVGSAPYSGSVAMMSAITGASVGWMVSTMQGRSASVIFLTNESGSSSAGSVSSISVSAAISLSGSASDSPSVSVISV